MRFRLGLKTPIACFKPKVVLLVWGDGMRVLISEDEERIKRRYSAYVKRKHYEVDCVEDGNDGLMLAEKEIYDIIVLDIMLPGKSGLEVLKELRNQGKTTPVLLLTALDAIDDRVSGLNLGADDYLGKPFSMAELLARIKALSRRIQTVYISEALRLGNMRLEADNLTLTIDEEKITYYREASLWSCLRTSMVFQVKIIVEYGDNRVM
jgi:DNA-binding response OmpR family regulator